MDCEPKTLIGVLASHDSPLKNEALKDLLDSAVETKEGRDILTGFSFVFTGGTYKRLFNERHPAVGQESKDVKHELNSQTKEFLLEHCGVVRLPPTEEGGVTILSSLISRRMISVLWTFFSSLTTHLLFPDNLAMLRLADQWRVKKLMNSGSITEWLQSEGKRDARLNPQSIDVELELPGSGVKVSTENKNGVRYLKWKGLPFPDFVSAKAAGTLEAALEGTVLALISHDEMKGRMLDFVIDHEQELRKFGRILATGTTGRLVGEAAPSLSANIFRYHSGPKGGDVEIATEILFEGCHVVVFFVDPLNPHPHTEDIRVVFGACMIHDRVRMLSNEIQARHWMDRMIRGA